MTSLFGSNGCATISHETICANNLTLIFYDGHIRNISDCTVDTCSLLVADFEYLPNLGGNIFFAILFAVIFIVNIPLGLRRKTWGVLVGLTVGALCELLGYIGRIMAHYQPFKFTPFLIYIIFLTIGPAFFSAAIYLCLARIIVVYGEGNSRFRPRTYSILFMVSDFVALLLQGAGGGIAATASDSDINQAQMGINIMIAGLAWQVASLTAFAIAAADFARCVKKGRGVANPALLELRQSRRFKTFLWALGLATLAIYIRSVYRVAELSQGFSGDIANAEVPFMIFEPSFVSIACILLTIWHPSIVFGTAWQMADFRVGKAKLGTNVEMESGKQYMSASSSEQILERRN